MYAAEAAWMKRYDLKRRSASPCLAPLIRTRCRSRFELCPFCAPFRFDHAAVYGAPDGATLVISQNYDLSLDCWDRLKEHVQALGLHMVINPRGAAWWHERTYLIVISNKPIPDHGYRYTEEAKR